MSTPEDIHKPFDNKSKRITANHITAQQGTPEYDEWRAKISSSLKGNVPWNKGKKTGGVPWNKGVPMSDETKAKVSANRRGIPRSPEDIARTTEANRGKKRTPEQRARIGASREYHKPSPETIAKMSEAKRGKPSGRKGVRLSEEAVAKMSLSRKGIPNEKLRGHKHTDEFRTRISNRNKEYWKNATEDQRRIHLDKLHEAAKDITKSMLEDVIALELDLQEITYETQKAIGWYRVDFYIPKQNLIIEANGCFWHACEQCGEERHKETRLKDAKRYEYLQRKGFSLKIIWEHERKDELNKLRRSKGG